MSFLEPLQEYQYIFQLEDDNDTCIEGVFLGYEKVGDITLIKSKNAAGSIGLLNPAHFIIISPKNKTELFTKREKML